MKQVLVVDDEQLLRQVLRTLLERKGFEVREAANGSEALKLFAAEPVALVITDIVMPDMEGIEMITRLRRTHPTVKIIALTGSLHASSGRYLDMAETLGADYTFPKPFDTAELLAAIRQLVGA